MAFTKKESLEDFALKSNHLAKMTGVAVAAHAIGDAYMLMHSGVGCKYKAAAQVARHDWVQHPNRKEGWTEVSEGSLIQGASGRIGPYARQWYDRRHYGVLLVASAYFIELTGDDLAAKVADVEANLPVPAIFVNTVAPNGGLFDGYSTVMLEVAERQPWSAPWKAPRAISFAGFFFHRYEADQKADVAAVRALAKVAGLEDGPILFSGQDYGDLSRAHESRFVGLLPYTAPHTRKFQELMQGRELIPLDLPIGMGGTARFVRELASRSGAPSDKVEAWIGKQVDGTRAAISQVAGFRGLRVALLADTPLAIGLASMLREMGLDLAMVGLRDDLFGGEEGFRAGMAHVGAEINGDTLVVPNPSLRRIRADVLDRIDREDVHLVIGSSIDLDLFLHARGARGARRWVPLVETGFPSVHQHATVPMPTFGFPGVLSWAQRLTDAVLQPRLGIPQATH